MKTSNIFISVLATTILTGMVVTNLILKNECLKININDPFKSYVSIEFEPYSVLDISGSNGYPIEILAKENEDVKVLRSRLEHFKSEVINDTLFIQFTGSNVSMKQSFLSTTPSGIIIHKKNLSRIITSDTHNRVSGYSNQDLTLKIKGNSYVEVSNVNLQSLNVLMNKSSQIAFTKENQVDSINLIMNNATVAHLEKIKFSNITHILSDSITLVLSKNTFTNLINKK